MSETTRILDQLQRAFDGDAWSGPSLLQTLEGISAAQAAARPLPQAHSIWEIVLHLITWTDLVRLRVEQHQNVPLTAEDWPEPPAAPDEDAWQHVLTELRQAHNKLVAALAALTDSELDEQLGEVRDLPNGSGVSYYVLLHGIAQHNLYHAGQIALLRKLI